MQGIYFFNDIDYVSQFIQTRKDISELACFILSYRALNGEVGFNVDGLSLQLLGNILQNAVGWYPYENRLRSFSENHDQNPDAFIASLYRHTALPAATTRITYHNPCEEFFDTTSWMYHEISLLPSFDRELVYSRIPKLLPACEYIVIWKIGNMEPLVFY